MRYLLWKVYLKKLWMMIVFEYKYVSFNESLKITLYPCLYLQERGIYTKWLYNTCLSILLKRYIEKIYFR